MRERFPVVPDAARGGEGSGGLSGSGGGGVLKRWLRLRLQAAPRPQGPPHSDEAMERTIADLSRRQEDMAFLGGVAQLFQACRTVAEVCDVARDRLESLSPHLSGALYLMSEGRDYLDNVMAWGGIDASSAAVAPHDCWALRRGRPHQVGRSNDAIACGHAEAEAGDAHLCVPMMAQGEALGVLYFRADAGAAGVPAGALFADDRLQFYFNVAETLSLAVANMRLRETLQDQAIRDPLTGLSTAAISRRR